jgi:2'-5' RNA ligase
LTRSSTLFLAVPVGAAERRVLAPWIAGLVGLGPGVRPVQLGGLHLSLRYLGQVNPEEQGAVAEIAAEVARTSRRFAISLGSPELSPSGKSPRVIWCPVGEGQEKLAELAESLAVALVGQGWQLTMRPFIGHCTLARLSARLAPGATANLEQLCARWAGDAPLGLPVESFSLMESVPVVGQPNSYPIRRRWRLGPD